MNLWKDNARCNSGRKKSLEVFGGAPRLLQAGVFAQVAPTLTVPDEEEKTTGSSLLESLMIDSAATTRSRSSRTLALQLPERPDEEWDAVAPHHRRYSLEEGKKAADPHVVVYSGYQEGACGICAQVQRALSAFQQTFLVTDATQPDCPILFASSCFLAMTGYSHGEVVGRNCRFLQGPGTDRREVARIRDALRSERHSYSGRLLNYKKNGSPFWNLLTITPIRDAHDRVIMSIGLQAEVSKHTEGCREKVLRPNGLSASLIRYESRQIDQAADAVSEIVAAFRKTSLSLAPQADVDPNNARLDLQPGHTSDSQEPCPQSKIDNVPGQAPGRRRRRLFSGIKLMSLLGFNKSGSGSREVVHDDGTAVTELLATASVSWSDVDDDEDNDGRAVVIRRAFDLATSLERIEKNFVITDPRLPDNPIIFASDQFLELTEYAREDVLGRNCRLLQGPDTDPATVRQIKDAVTECRDITVQLLNYTKSGTPFWNLFHLQAVRDPKGELQYFIGVQQNPHERLSDQTERERAKLVQQTAIAINAAVRELPDANLSPEKLWAIHSKPVFPKPHMQRSSEWKEILKARRNGPKLGLKSFRPIKPLGCGDTGSVHLVELRGTGQVFAMKAMDKAALLSRNKVHRACAERQILELLDHPFLPTLYASFQTVTHVCLIMNFCPGSELYLALERQPKKHFREESARFYAAEIIVALEYLHCLGVVYRDLKPENILIQDDGHVQLTDFDLSINSSANLQMMETPESKMKRKRKMSLTKRKRSKHTVFFAEPVASSNSFVGTEEYIAPEIITGHGHSSAVDWWSLGILLYEMLFGRTPFKGSNRQKTFANILAKDLVFPPNIPVSLEARQLIQGLLARETINRLGSTLGAHDIKSHPFFRNLKWPLLRCMTPPPLEVPVHYTESSADIVKNSADYEWDNVEATSPFFGAF